jgi:hypothetical protein
MRHPYRIAAILAVGAFLTTFAFAQDRLPMDTLPAWLQQSIATYEAHPGGDAPQSIWQITHHGAPAFYVVAPCCDRYNDLLDDMGRKICSPSGGIAGHGDGQCPAPVDPGTPVHLVWSNPRSSAEAVPAGLGIPWPYHPDDPPDH